MKSNLFFILFIIALLFIIGCQKPRFDLGPNPCIELRNKEAEALVQQCETLLEETEQTSQKIFCMQLTVHVYSDEIEGVLRKAETILQLFSGLNGAEMHRERWGAVEPIFRAAACPKVTQKRNKLIKREFFII